MILPGLPRAPTGLLELLGLKSGGAQPNAVEGTVAPSLDVFPYWAMEKLFSANTAFAAAAETQTQTVTVTFPRIYLAFSGQITLGAAPGTRLSMRLGVRAPSAASPLTVLAQEYVAAPHLVAGEFYEIVWLAAYPVVFPPGAQFVLRTAGDAAGADHVVTMKALSLDLSSTG